ncbi:MAG: Holliday junction resolvase RuvX [Ammonifex sp.]|jgi:putative Holliday junction resolvase|nr:MAG: Holliday junction resolvase RuvX [Ammonifex sp.]
MRFLGLDVGDRKIGVAVSDPLCITAQGVGVLKRGNPSDDADEILGLIAEYEVGEVVVGNPGDLYGRKGTQADKVMEFVNLLRQKGVSVTLWDERFTTSAAERLLIGANVRREKRRQVIDKLAAVLILQSYLDSRKRPDAGGS